MLTTAELDEYLAQIRSQVCANCVERPHGGPPCAPLGKLCGVEQYLPELIEAIHDSFGASMVPYFESKRRRVCDQCSFRQSESCPCPTDHLLVLIVEAVEAVDARHECRRPARPHHAGLEGTDRFKLGVIQRLHEEATGAWTGCDWPTRFGKSCLNLKGWTATGARKNAVALRGTAQGSEWEAAAD